MRDHLVHWLEQFLPSSVAQTIAPSWFMCVGIAGLAMLGLTCIIARRRGIDTGVIASIVVWAYFAAVIAGIVVPATIECVTALVTTGHFQIRWAGMTSFWGYLAAFTTMAIICRRHKLPFARFGDLAAAPLGVALFFARLGCFVAGCDYGKVTSVPWAVRFPANSSAWRDHVHAGLLPADRAESLPVHPTQLYEALLGVVIVGVALAVSRTKWVRSTGREGGGTVVLACAATYAIGRIGIETLRGDLGRGIYGGLSSGQIFSIGVLVAIFAGMLFAHRRRATLVATTACAVLMLVTLGDIGDAHAQVPAPQPAPQPYPPPAPQPYPQPAPQPYQPQPYPQPQPYYPPPPPMQPTQPTQAATPATSHVQLGVLLGFASALNRRSEQVPALGGPTLSIGWIGTHTSFWFDFDSFGNSDASHGTLLLSGGAGKKVNEKLYLGGRVGIGMTLVNFERDAFEDVSGTTFRFEAIAEYALSSSWIAWVRPMSFDILTASDLGGPITTYQMRLGLGYRFGIGAKPARPAVQPQPYPYQPQPYSPSQPYPPPQPYPQPQPQPYPQPPPQPQPAPTAPEPQPAPTPAPELAPRTP